MAVAAVAIGVLISKQRQDRPDRSEGVPAGETQPTEQSLDAIRAAGL
jgi:hypothetical protein